MTDQTVNTLAEKVGVPVERLLNQMEEAGLTRRAATDAVSDEERKSLLSHLQKAHGGEGDNAEWSIQGATDAVEFVASGQDLVQTFEWAFLKEFFNSKYNF